MAHVRFMRSAACGALLALLFFPDLPAAAAPAPASSPAQADGIVSAAVDDLWAQTDAYWHVGDYPRIIALDRIITQADPHFVESFNTGAWLMWSSGLDSDAEAFYQQAVQNNPHTPAAYYDYGQFLFNHKHDYHGAIRVFTQDVARAQPGVLDWRMLAHSYEKAERWDRAVAVWRRIKARWPHGAPGDPSHGGVDDRNLQRALSHLKAAPQPEL
ncbi:MAG: hypothetical protein M3Y28_11525 [Armatimonadota bacterium]|nr:hypothetical protein [Armatimonadota bacterium]